MTRTVLRTQGVLLVCFVFAAGCNRSGNADVAKAQADAEAARAEAKVAKDELAKSKADAEAAKAELAKLRKTLEKSVQVAPPSPDRKAAEWVLRADGSVKVVSDGVSLVVNKDGKLPDGPIKLIEITLKSPKASDDGTSFLSGLKDLRVLIIYPEATTITNFDFVEQMPALEVLQGPAISDAHLAHIKGLSNLKELRVGHPSGNARITDAGLERVKDMKQLEVLGLRGCSNISDAGLQQLKGLGLLRTLVLSGTKIGDTGLEHLKGLPKLEILEVQRTKVTEAGVKSLQGGATEL